MQLVRVVPLCEVIPRGYGVAWVDPLTGAARCVPLGLNVVVGLVRRVAHALRCGVGDSSIDVRVLAVFRHGYGLGRSDGETAVLRSLRTFRPDRSRPWISVN